MAHETVGRITEANKRLKWAQRPEGQRSNEKVTKRSKDKVREIERETVPTSPRSHI